MSQHYTAADRSYDLWAFAKDYGAEDFEADADEAGAEHRARNERDRPRLEVRRAQLLIDKQSAAGEWRAEIIRRIAWLDHLIELTRA